MTQNLVGKKLRSKINGAIFYVVNRFTAENGIDYYTITDALGERKTAHSCGWFEKGIMQNLEIIEEEGIKSIKKYYLTNYKKTEIYYFCSDDEALREAQRRNHYDRTANWKAYNEQGEAIYAVCDL